MVVDCERQAMPFMEMNVSKGRIIEIATVWYRDAINIDIT